MHASSASQPAAPRQTRRGRWQPRVQPGGRGSEAAAPASSTRTLSSPVTGARPLLRAAARSWTRPGRPRPTASPLAPGALSATYWGSARAVRRGRGPGRGPVSERLQRAGDPTREKARGAAATFQVRADRSSRRRAAQGGQGTWAPH